MKINLSSCTVFTNGKYMVLMESCVLVSSYLEIVVMFLIDKWKKLYKHKCKMPSPKRHLRWHIQIYVNYTSTRTWPYWLSLCFCQFYDTIIWSCNLLRTSPWYQWHELYLVTILQCLTKSVDGYFTLHPRLLCKKCLKMITGWVKVCQLVE